MYKIPPIISKVTGREIKTKSFLLEQKFEQKSVENNNAIMSIYYNQSKKA